MVATTLNTAQSVQSESGMNATLSGVRQRIKVCHLSMTLKTGGLERLLVDFAKFHDSSQYELHFVSLAELGPPADDLKAAGHDVHTIGLPHVSKTAAIKELKKYFQTSGIQVLHTHNTYPHFYGALAARLAGVRTVINTQHGRGCGPGWKSLWQFRIANLLSSRIVGVSDDATRLCQSQDPANRKRIQCVWNGIDLERFRFTGPQLNHTAISVARLSPEKDYSTLFRAIPKVLEAYPDFRLKLVGNGAERDLLEALARELHIENSVEFLGERKDIPDLLRTAGFYVSSSKTEGISLTLLEAMAVGLPIVTTRVGGNPEIVVPGVTGKLVDSQNPDQLANAMIEMLDEQPLWPAMADAARVRVAENFNIRTMIRNYEALYSECLAAK
ncbi:glycosyltransferase [Planctomicrobium sp. SH668]|uniref:glycosyltransferase n=1 Tax=Planctomicrobium sp. SH668 TaxID=3448126 RepID=UPI003F5B34C9